MKILLINPIVPHAHLIEDYALGDAEALKGINSREVNGPPLALNDLAGVLHDEEVRILDLRVEYGRDKNFDIEGAIYKELKDLEPDIVGVTCMTAQVNSGKKILKLVKDYNSKILRLAGGIHPSSNPHDFVDSEVDIIVIGLGKKTILRIVDEFKKNRGQKDRADFSKIPGLAQKKDGKLCFTKQLSAMSLKEIKEEYYCSEIFPNRTLTDKYDYRIKHKNQKIHYLNTAIGCTSRCNFCYLWKFANKFYIYRDVDNIVEELKTMDQYPIIRFCDAHSFGDVKSAKSLFSRILELGIKNEFVADVRTDTIVKYPDVMELAVKAGLKVTIIGLEAVTDENLEKYGKNSTIRTTEDAIKIMNDLGVWISGNYIVDYDFGEKDFDNMARFVEDHPIFFSGFTIITPFPGTEQYNFLKDKIVNKNFDYYNLLSAVVKTRLSEDIFYQRIIDLYKTGYRSREKYFKLYNTRG